MKKLRTREDIDILTADKGRCTVVLDKDTYIEKIMTLLEDSATYRKLKKDPTMTAENKMNTMLLGLKKKGIPAEALYRCINVCIRQEDTYHSFMAFLMFIKQEFL